jgi:hypothetical protein
LTPLELIALDPLVFVPPPQLNPLKLVQGSVKVTPVGAEATVMLLSVNVVCACELDADPTTVR